MREFARVGRNRSDIRDLNLRGSVRRTKATRERNAEYLAERLSFDLEKQGDFYSLRRKTGGFEPQHNLSLDEVEKVLQLWKLKGPHGG